MTATAPTTQPPTKDTPATATATPRIAYVAYPTSLTLGSANAIHTYNLARTLREIVPGFALLVPRFARRPSRFAEVGATHLARLPFNAGRHLVPGIAWSYAERTWFAARVLAHLRRARLAGRGPEVLYVRDAVLAAWLGTFARPLIGARVVYECHDLEANNPSANRGPVSRRLARAADRAALTRADGVVSLTRAFVDEIAQNAAVRPSAPVAVIPDAYDDEVFRPADRDDARRALGLPPDAFIVGYVGSTWAYRGVDRLVAAFAPLHAARPDARLVLVGGRANERAEIERQARDFGQAGLGDAVSCVGSHPPAVVARYMAAADALTLVDTVSKASASPLKLFEYAACARPVILPDAPALREILPDDAARYFPPDDAAALTAALAWVADNPDAARAMGARAAAAVAPHTYRARAAVVAAFCAGVAASDERRAATAIRGANHE